MSPHTPPLGLLPEQQVLQAHEGDVVSWVWFSAYL
jgi:hypothetical protein